MLGIKFPTFSSHKTSYIFIALQRLENKIVCPDESDLIRDFGREKISAEHEIFILYINLKC